MWEPAYADYLVFQVNMESDQITNTPVEGSRDGLQRGQPLHG